MSGSEVEDRETWDISAAGQRDLKRELSEYYGVEEIWHHGDFEHPELDRYVCEVLTYWDGEENHYIAHDVPVYGHGPSGAVGCFEEELPDKELVRRVVESVDDGEYPPDDVTEQEVEG